MKTTIGIGFMKPTIGIDFMEWQLDLVFSKNLSNFSKDFVIRIFRKMASEKFEKKLLNL
jgi:hypothetical protein